VRVPQGAPGFDLRDVKEFRCFGSRRLADTILDNVSSRKI